MKVFEKFNELKVFGKEKSIEEILNYVYAHRIYISDVLDENFPDELLKEAEWFLENDEEYDGCEKSAWKRFLKKEMFEGEKNEG